jgi:hypothetical protein
MGPVSDGKAELPESEKASGMLGRVVSRAQSAEALLR